MTMVMNDVIYLSIADAAAEIEAGKLSPVDLTKAAFEQIEKTDGQLNSYVLLMKELHHRRGLRVRGRPEARVLVGRQQHGRSRVACGHRPVQLRANRHDHHGDVRPGAVRVHGHGVHGDRLGHPGRNSDDRVRG